MNTGRASMARNTMKIEQATRSYEQWMPLCGPIVEQHLRRKHSKMREDPFQFLRGSYYRWAQVWRDVCPDCACAPEVIAVGDLHIDSYGTWRDTEGRLCWGVDDFAEAYPLPYTNDLIRLATSVKIARRLGLIGIKTRVASEIVIDAYRTTLQKGGCPFVLAESETQLERLGIDALKTPKGFWEKLNQLRTVRHLPRDARESFAGAFPIKELKFRVVQREAGLGSLGQQRFVAIAHCNGGYVAREAKRVVPSASAWLRGKISCFQSYYQQAMSSAVRSPDPYQTMSKRWLLRRLSPDSNPIKIEELSGKRDEDTLLHAMGSEVANVHLGSKRRIRSVLTDVNRRKRGWLHQAARQMTRSVLADWKEFEE